MVQVAGYRTGMQGEGLGFRQGLDSGWKVNPGLRTPSGHIVRGSPSIIVTHLAPEPLGQAGWALWHSGLGA